LKYDRTSPSLTFVNETALEDATYTSGNEINIGPINVVEAHSGVNDATLGVTLSGFTEPLVNTLSWVEADEQIEGTVTIPAGIDTGTKQLTVSIADNVGNPAGQAVLSLDIDNTPPSAPNLLAPADEIFIIL